MTNFGFQPVKQTISCSIETINTVSKVLLILTMTALQPTYECTISAWPLEASNIWKQVLIGAFIICLQWHMFTTLLPKSMIMACQERWAVA